MNQIYRDRVIGYRYSIGLLHLSFSIFLVFIFIFKNLGSMVLWDIGFIPKVREIKKKPLLGSLKSLNAPKAIGPYISKGP